MLAKYLIAIFKKIREQKEFTFSEICRITASKHYAWVILKELIEKGFVKPTVEIGISTSGLSELDPVYTFVGGDLKNFQVWA